MARIYLDPEEQKPTRMEASSRFWCGFALGLFIGVVLAIKYWPTSPAVAILFLTVSVVICGAVAVRYGDEFWHRVGEILVKTFRM